jgi:glycine/D-amino acid oxidase-like deaminating enzyme
VPEVLRTSPLSYIRGRTYFFLRDTILVVANEAGASSPARLFALDPLSLKAVRQSAEEVYPQTAVLIQGGSIYAVIAGGGQYRLARFDGELRLAATSPVPVDRDSSLSLFENRLLVNAEDRSVLFLDRIDLRQIGALP